MQNTLLKCSLRHLNYYTDGQPDEIRLNEISGNWQPSDGMYIIQNRSVGAHSGQPLGSSLNEVPSGNTFSYPTNFGFNDFIYETNSLPRAWSSADVTVSGMSGTSYTIEVEFTFPNV